MINDPRSLLMPRTGILLPHEVGDDFALACEAMSALTVTKQTSKVANNFIASDTETPQVLKPNYFRATAGPEGLREEEDGVGTTRGGSLSVGG